MVKNMLAAVGFLTVLVVGWRYRGQVTGLVRSVREAQVMAPAAGVPEAAPRPADGVESGGAASAPPVVRRPARNPVQGSPAATGAPSEAALRSARRKEESMERAGGPGTVTLSAAEMASLIHDGLGPAGRQALDSLEVALHPGRLELRAVLVTEALRGVLGPFATMLEEHEPMRASGPARVASRGVAAWEPDSFIVRAFPFPAGFVPPMVDRLTGGRNGVVPIRVPTTVGELRIAPTGVTFYRRAEP
ncbi:MAG TPA: hypothetical protein VD793_01685 [Gemmatimonadales bacterium]|nr:hypothetical protein [Gemmatimonadales bacterium]